MRKRDWSRWILFSAVTVLVVYALTADDFNLRVLRGVTVCCQKTARTVGKWGIHTESYYLRLIERGRMN